MAPNCMQPSQCSLLPSILISFGNLRGLIFSWYNAVKCQVNVTLAKKSCDGEPLFQKCFIWWEYITCVWSEAYIRVNWAWIRKIRKLAKWQNRVNRFYSVHKFWKTLVHRFRVWFHYKNIMGCGRHERLGGDSMETIIAWFLTWKRSWDLILILRHV